MRSKHDAAVGPQVRERKPAARNKFIPMLGIISFVAGLQAATQTFAHIFNYPPVLGGHFMHIYAPWDIFVWSARWWGQYPTEIMQAASIGVFVTAGGLLVVAVMKIVARNSSKPHRYSHGSARWADKKDIQDAGLLPRSKSLFGSEKHNDSSSSGVCVGGWEDKDGTFHYLRHSGPEHVLTYAPTRSGKGVGLVVPTLLSWAHSCVITDLKGELWALTAGWRKKHARNRVLRFEPAALNGGIRWNPLEEIRIGTEYEVGDVQNLATVIVDPDGKGLESHWQKTAWALLVGVMLHVLYKSQQEGTPATLPAVDAILSDPDRDIAELWMEMITFSHINGEVHPVIGAAARDMLDRPEEEAGSVLSTAKSYLSLYRDPVVARNISQCQFHIKDLMNNNDPVSLYIITQPNDKARLRPLVRVFLNMMIRLLADRMDFEDGRPVAHYKHRLLAMLDEFPSIGKLEVLQESLAFLAGYGIRFYLICQDLNQLKSRETGYGPDETVTSNCHVQNAYPPNRIETAEHLSRLTGQTTVLKERITTSGRRISMMHSNVSTTFDDHQRPLLTPDECLRMPGPLKNADGLITAPGDMVIYVAGYPAIYGRQPLYFNDPVFQARASIPAPKVTDVLVRGYDPEHAEIVL
ncbi:type IV secretory system conjugative DNA transfer family protein [Thiolapillus sp.]|uniref:type IV secretory system conjugative DNA transfer family protein n=1 Tax=Thiolapillus sp. TaxID=2017437 RepID=UPI0025F72174|nr:type IV secretory system conjugative DNA transfer family protein [Thiolapillus sp.]